MILLCFLRMTGPWSYIMIGAFEQHVATSNLLVILDLGNSNCMCVATSVTVVLVLLFSSSKRRLYRTPPHPLSCRKFFVCRLVTSPILDQPRQRSSHLYNPIWFTQLRFKDTFAHVDLFFPSSPGLSRSHLGAQNHTCLDVWYVPRGKGHTPALKKLTLSIASPNGDLYAHPSSSA